MEGYKEMCNNGFCYPIKINYTLNESINQTDIHHFGDSPIEIYRFDLDRIEIIRTNIIIFSIIYIVFYFYITFFRKDKLFLVDTIYKVMSFFYPLSVMYALNVIVGFYILRQELNLLQLIPTVIVIIGNFIHMKNINKLVEK